MKKFFYLLIGFLVLFAASAKGETYLYTSGNTPSGHNNNDVAYVGATLYQCQKVKIATEVEYNSSQHYETTVWYNGSITLTSDNFDTYKSYCNNNSYYKVAQGDSSYKYYLIEEGYDWVEKSYSNDSKPDRAILGAYSDESNLPLVTNSDNEKYAIVGGTRWDNQNGTWVKEVTDVETSWDSETQTLTVSAEDGTSENLPGIVASDEYSNGKDNVKKVVFSDESEYDAETGILTATGDAAAHKAALVAAGFTVSSTIVELGKYVRVVDGVTILTIPDDEVGTVIGNLEDYSSGAGKLTRAEKEAITGADMLKLVGEFTSTDWTYLTNAGSASEEKTYYTYSTEEVDEPVLDGEGNPLLDDEGNAVTDKVTRTVSIPHTGRYVETLDLSDAKIPDGESGVKLTNNLSHVKSVLLPTDANYTEIPSGFAAGAQLASIAIPSNIEKIGGSAFAHCALLTSVDFSNATNLREFGESAFEQCDITGDLVIPASVEIIGEKAFKNSWHIKSVTFPKGTQLYGEGHGIRANAFWMDGAKNDLDNVYVLEDDPTKLINCDVMAFDYDNTDGQTVMSTVKTRLHYPANLYYYYVGEWKSRVNNGVVEGHEELLALRNIIENAENGTYTTSWSTGSITLTEDEYKWVNGFWKFISSGIPVTFDTDWRTYSDVANIKVPQYANKVADVFVVCGFEADAETNKGRVLLKQMKEGDIIPAHTGIIIHHYVKDKQNGGVLNFPHVTNEEAAALSEEALKPYRFVSEGDQRATPWADDERDFWGISTRNYVPTGETLPSDYLRGYPNYLEYLDCKGQSRVIYNAENNNIIDQVTLEMQSYKGQKVWYRNFLFGNGSAIQHAKEEAENGNVYDRETNPDGYRDYTDPTGWDPEVHGKMGWGFFRCMSRLYTVNSKAFLHFPADVFTQAKGGATTAINEGKILETISGVISGAKPMELGFFDENDPFVVSQTMGGIATAIRQIDNTETSDDYYTIQGVKVVAPTQNGIYIHNGKKVIVK